LDSQDVIARGQFRHDTAIWPMDIVLVGDCTGAHCRASGALRFDYGSGRVIA
jgi:hypothetical protein